MTHHPFSADDLDEVPTPDMALKGLLDKPATLALCILVCLIFWTGFGGLMALLWMSQS